MTARPNWRKIADHLASRMMNHAFCGDHIDHETAAKEGCPFCHDVVVYKEYLAAGGTEKPFQFEGTTVSVSDLVKRWEAEANG